jgi:protoporphyrinogen oxidase
VVGGLARTVDYKGYRFDVGGHRFFTKVDEVERIWREILGGDFVERRRLSRIHYRNRFFYYPLRPLNALRGLGLTEASLVLGSYLKSHLKPIRPETNLEQWVSNRFGQRLYRIFFKTYTEKVWGIPCAEIGAEWAAQRIKNFSLGRALLGIVYQPRGKGKITTLIDHFHYPVRGPGMMWEKLAQQLCDRGQDVRLQHEVVRVNHNGSRPATSRNS